MDVMAGQSLEERLRQEVPHLPEGMVAELVRAVDRLVAAFTPERIYLFGSQARGEGTPDSDVDILVVVPDTDVPPYKLDQAAYHAVGSHTIPMDILVMPHEEFEWRSRSPASLPSTVLREGKTLYAA